MLIHIDLTNDPRAKRIQHNLDNLKKAMLELLENPDIAPLKSLYADLKDYRNNKSERALAASKRARTTTVNSRKKLIQSIINDGYKDFLPPVLVCYMANSDQVNLVGGGSHRTAIMSILNKPLNAVLVDSTKNFEP